MEANKYCYEYPRPAVTTDCVIFGFDNGELKILLVERGIEPYKGRWALPGGFMQMDENTEQCARRELFEETGVENLFIEQLFTFSDVDRDPRGRVVTISYYALIKLSDYKIQAGDDAPQCPVVSSVAGTLAGIRPRPYPQGSVKPFTWKNQVSTHRI